MKKNLRTIAWQNNAIRLIDQTRLPGELVYCTITDIRRLWQAIKELKVRGAPAIGAAAALGVYLGVRGSKAQDYAAFMRDVSAAAAYLASARPTARNLFWGLERMSAKAASCKGESVAQIKKALLKEALLVIEEDRSCCRSIGRHGSALFKSGDRVLTVCNTGILATIDYGTALGVLYRCKEEGKKLKVFACETRPLLQGARLTTWELSQAGMDATLICDNMAAALMARGMIDKVIAGADRIAANGDTANKIGTYSLAVLAAYHRIPFYIAAPLSTFDTSIADGSSIVIEQRPAAEITTLFYRKKMCADRIKVYNPAFDVTDHRLISAIITEKGVLRPPFRTSIRRVFPGR